MLRIGHIYWGNKWKTSFFVEWILHTKTSFEIFTVISMILLLEIYFKLFTAILTIFEWPIIYMLLTNKYWKQIMKYWDRFSLYYSLHCMTSFPSGLCTLARPQTGNSYTGIFLSLLQYFLSILRRKHNMTIKHNIPMVVKHLLCIIHSLCIYMHVTIFPLRNCFYL